MKNTNRPPTEAFFIALWLLQACCWIHAADKPQTTEAGISEQKAYELIQKRLRVHEDVLTAASWTLCHCADEKQMEAVERTLRLLPAFAETNGFTKLVQAGGIRKFEADVAEFLRSKDPLVRGFGAMLLGVMGDPAYKTDIAALLADKRSSAPAGESRPLWNFDRSRAAMALGLMGAREYAPRLLELLRSSDQADRTGAALGLGYMGAKDQASAIAKLLTDDADQVQTAALQALAELEAVEYAKEIAGRLTSLGDPSVQATACYALARINAKKQASNLAVLLRDEFRKGDAAKALALLGAKEYAKDIAALTEDGDPLVRSDALIALGILEAKESIERIATHLRDNEPFVRADAAVALLLMRDQAHSNEVVEAVSAEGEQAESALGDMDSTKYFQSRLRLHPVVAGIQQRLVERALQEWQRIVRSQIGRQLDRATNDSRLIRSETNSTSSAAGSPR